MPMELYADESGIHQGSKLCVVAGLCGGQRKFIELERVWKKHLEDFAITHDVGFHAKDFFKRGRSGKLYGVYEGWSDNQAQDFIAKAVELIHTRGLKPVGGAVDVPYFNSLPFNLRRWLTGGEFDVRLSRWTSSGAPDKPYFFAFHQAVISAADFAHDRVTINGIFDRQDNFSGLAKNLWEQIKEDPRLRTSKRLGTISFCSRFERPCLQVADLVAHCFHHVDKYRADTDRPEIAIALHLLGREGVHVRRLGERSIATLSEGYPEELKEQDRMVQQAAEVAITSKRLPELQ